MIYVLVNKSCEATYRKWRTYIYKLLVGKFLEKGSNLKYQYVQMHEYKTLNNRYSIFYTHRSFSFVGIFALKTKQPIHWGWLSFATNPINLKRKIQIDWRKPYGL